MKSIITLILLFYFSPAKSQYVKAGDSLIKVDYLESVSYFWKMDSLGTNGYRYCAYPLILNYIDKNKLTVEHLVNHLGKPTEISNNRGTTYYKYHYFNGSLIPIEANLATELFYIYFEANEGSNYISKIGKGETHAKRKK